MTDLNIVPYLANISDIICIFCRPFQFFSTNITAFTVSRVSFNYDAFDCIENNLYEIKTLTLFLVVFL